MSKSKKRKAKLERARYADLCRRYLRSISFPGLKTKPSPSQKELAEWTLASLGLRGKVRGSSLKKHLQFCYQNLPEGFRPAAAPKGMRASPGKALPGIDREFIISDAFLESYEWKRLRYEVLKKHDGLCEVCGRGRPHGQVLNVDHIKPRRKHPELALDIKNLQVLCGDCNHGKGNWDSTDWRDRTPAISPEERAMDREAWERFEKF